MNDEIMKAVQEITRRHREIINDWCKAYLAQLYEEGVNIKPGCFTLNEQNLDSVGGSVFGKKYWFEKGTPNYSNWIRIKDRVPEISYLESDNEDDPYECYPVLVNAKEHGHTYCVAYLVKEQDETKWGFGELSWELYIPGNGGDIIHRDFDEFTHWMPLPNPPTEEI